MAHTPEQLRAVFEQTLSPHAATRKNAEAVLSQAQKQLGHPLIVLQLVEGETNAAIRQAAAVHFKNVVKNGWDAENDSGVVISPQDRDLIKNNLVQLMCSVPPSIQSQCSESIKLIAAQDFPAKWDNLLPMLVEKFASADPRVVNGVLLTANSLFKRFRYVQRSDSLYSDILYSLKHMQAPLLTLFQTTNASVDSFQGDQMQLIPRFESLRLISRIMFSLNYQDLPEFFEDNMKAVMTINAKFLKYENPLLTDDDEDTDPSPIDQLQAAIVENLNLYTDKDEECFLPYLGDFTQLVWGLLMRATDKPKHDVLATKCIRFLASLVKKKMHSDLFKEDATLRQIIASIVIPNLKIREVDEERFEDDPAEYIATDIEGSETESRRKCSQELLRAMCRQFGPQSTVICMQHIGTMLQEYQSNPGANWAAKDAAIHLMFGISIEAESSQGVSQVNGLPSLMEFFSTHVFPELQDGNHQAQKMLKATAVKFVMTFRNQFSKEQLVALTPLLITHLASPIVVVHTYAAMTIERIMTTKDETKQPKFGIDELRPFLNTIFAALFGIIDNTNNNENEYAMKCIMRTLSVAGADIVPATQEVLDKLTPALARVAKNPRNPQYNHFLFESIAVLVKSVCQVEPTAAAAFEPLLFAQFQTILQMDVSEFTPYVFQIFAQLLEFRTQGTGLGEAYTNMLQPCLSPTAWERKGNIPALTRLLRAYLQQGAVEIVSSGSFMAMLGVWQKLVSSKANEQSSFELLSAIVRYVPPDALHPVWGQLYGILFRRLQASKTPRFTRLITNFFALFVGKFGSQAFFDQLNSMQPGMGLQIMMQVWLPRLKTDAPVRLDAKMHVVALTKLSCETAALLSDDNAKQLWGQTVATVVFLLTSPDAMIGQQVTDDGSAEMEISYDSSFSNLHFARKPAEDPFAEIADPARSFSQALGALSTSHPGHLQPIIQQSVGADPKLTTGLQTLLNSAGVQLA